MALPKTLGKVGRNTGGRNAGRLPKIFLVTDGLRQSDPLPALRKLPPLVGVLFRHYESPRREALARSVAKIARSRRLVLIIAKDWRLAARVNADGVHLPESLARGGRNAPIRGWCRRRGKFLTMACHSRRALGFARRLSADAAFLSPVFPTASHPEAEGMGVVRFARHARGAGLPVLALGGVTERWEKRLKQGGAAGMASTKDQVVAAVGF